MLQIITAGYFGTENIEEGPKWDEEVRMYTTSSIAPVFVVHRLLRAGLLKEGTKIVLVSSESGSIALRHEVEGGGNYAHHASKAALNMVGRLLSLDLRDKGVVVSIVHPGFMRTEMTKGVGFDKYWDAGGGKPTPPPQHIYPPPVLTVGVSRCPGRGGQVAHRVGGEARYVQDRGVLGTTRAARHRDCLGGDGGRAAYAASPAVVKHGQDYTTTYVVDNAEVPDLGNFSPALMDFRTVWYIPLAR